MIKLLPTNLFVMFCNKQFQVFTLYYHFLSNGVRLEHWRKQKPISQIEIKIGFFIKLY